MPNWCNSEGSVSGPSDFIQAIVDSDFNAEVIRPLGEGATRDTALAAWGTKWKPDVEVNHFEIDKDKGTGYLSFTMQTAWTPPIALWKYMCSEKECDVEAYYYEGGCSFCGVFDGEKDHCYDVPETADNPFWDTDHGQEIEDKFAILEEIREREREREEEDS